MWDAYLSGPTPRNGLNYEDHPHSAAVDLGRRKARAAGDVPIPDECSILKEMIRNCAASCHYMVRTCGYLVLNVDMCRVGVGAARGRGNCDKYRSSSSNNNNYYY